MAGSNKLSDQAILDLRKMKTITLGRTKGTGEANGESHRPANGKYNVQVVSNLITGSLDTPSRAIVDVFTGDPLTRSDDPDLQNMEVTVIGCFATSSSSSGPGAYSAGVIEYICGKWYLTTLFPRCKTVVTSVSCGSGGLSVTYGNANG